MTNEEAILDLQFLARRYDELDQLCYSINIESLDIAINSIQENTKLKAEIERLNGKSEMYRDMADSFCNSNIKLKAEIEQLEEEVNINKCWSDVVEKILKKEIDKNLELKSELEQSVKLPCKVGDVVYREITLHDSYDDSPYIVISACNFRLDMLDKIGKTVFLTREEAEQSLKGETNGH